MTDDAPIDAAAMRVLRRLPTLDHLEVLLLLERDHRRWWTSHDVAGVLFGDTGLVMQLLRDLAGRGLLVVRTRRDGAPAAFCFDPDSPATRDAVAGVRDAYHRRPFAVISIVRRFNSRAVRSLADAFRFRHPLDED